jgi:hypothetical protein
MMEMSDSKPVKGGEGSAGSCLSCVCMYASFYKLLSAVWCSLLR